MRSAIPDFSHSDDGKLSERLQTDLYTDGQEPEFQLCYFQVFYCLLR